MTKNYDEKLEALKRKHEEEALIRKARAGIQANNYNCSVRMFKNYCIKESTIKELTCEKCGKMFKTNSDKNLCFDCQKKNPTGKR